jgi:hypothetical protein
MNGAVVVSYGLNSSIAVKPCHTILLIIRPKIE